MGITIYGPREVFESNFSARPINNEKDSKEKIVSFQKALVRVISFSIIAIATATAAFGQDMTTSTWTQQAPKPPSTVAGANNLYCAGYIQTNAMSTVNKIIGGQNEADKFTFAENDFLYINMGRDKGVSVGDTFAVVRPRGDVRSKWSKKNDLGFYVQEVGAVEVVKVKQEMAAVRVKVSCDNFLLGDLVQLVEKRTSPLWVRGEALDIFGDPSGKAMGRVLMARDGQEMITRDQIAYVDLGADDSVRVGDKLTVFRPLELGNLTKYPDRESVSSRDYGFESEDYKGGKFSNQSTRKSSDKANGQEVRTADVRKDRPAGMRKVVGEAVVLNVKEKTATIVITRTAQEIHTGDWVEIK